MDSSFYQRIVEYASEITKGGDLPYSGLHTARACWAYLLKSSPRGLFPEEIGEEIGIAAQTAHQIILALQNGGVKIQTETAANDKATGRSRVKYRV